MLPECRKALDATAKAKGSGRADHHADAAKAHDAAASAAFAAGQHDAAKGHIASATEHRRKANKIRKDPGLAGWAKKAVKG